MNRTFVLSDESINRHGFIVLNSAIDLELFKKNPVMYYNHNQEKGVIGRWENLRFERGQLIGEPVFDEKDDFALKIKGKVEDGFIKSASIGFVASKEDINNRSTPAEVMKLDMFEISVCDVPSNKNAIALYSSDRKKVDNVNEYLKFTLGINQKDNEMNEFVKRLGEILKIENPTEESILSMANQLFVHLPDEMENRLNQALKTGLINKDSFSHLRAMGQSNPGALSGYLKGLEKEKGKAQDEKIEQHIQSNRKKFELVDARDMERIRDFARKDFNLFCCFTGYLPERVSLSEKVIPIKQDGETLQADRSKWTLSDYRKNDPEALRKSPELYRELLEKFNENR